MEPEHLHPPEGAPSLKVRLFSERDHSSSTLRSRRAGRGPRWDGLSGRFPPVLGNPAGSLAERRALGEAEDLSSVAVCGGRLFCVLLLKIANRTDRDRTGRAASS